MMTGLITRIAWLYYKEGLKESQIATMLGIDYGTGGAKGCRRIYGDYA
jgi:DNA-binding transcriptional regulator LsrR (DeoR family)